MREMTHLCEYFKIKAASSIYNKYDVIVTSRDESTRTTSDMIGQKSLRDFVSKFSQENHFCQLFPFELITSSNMTHKIKTWSDKV